MNGYEIVDTNAENIGGCGFCGYKDPNNLGHRRKTDWLKERYAEGLRFKVLRSREFGDIGMIEYAPDNHSWRPVNHLSTPYGVFSILYDGKLIADRPVSARRFSHIMGKIAEPARKVTGRTPPFIGTMMRSVRAREQ